MKITNSDRIIKSASVSGVRRIGDAKKKEVQRKPSKSSAKDVVLPATQTSSKDPGVKAQTPPSTTEITEHNEQWESNVLIALKEEVETLKQANIALTEQVDEQKAQYDDLSNRHNALLADIDAVKDQAVTKAYDDAYQSSVETKGEQDQKNSQALTAAIELLSNSADKQWQGVEQLAVEIGFSALLKIIAERLGNAEFTRGIVVNAVQKVRAERTLVVRLSPHDFDLLKDSMDQVKSELAKSSVDFVADARIELGGCIVEADHGSWDARLETQLLHLKDTLIKPDRA